MNIIILQSVFRRYLVYNNKNNFNLDIYLYKIKKEIDIILNRNQKSKFNYDILDLDENINIKSIILQEKQKRMKIGMIWQVILGNYKSFINLGIGHETGLDIISYEKKIIIELKNRTNTDNKSSRSYNIEKLFKFKKNNPEYLCIYGNINDNTKEKTLNGLIKTISRNDMEIKHYIGISLLKLVLEENYEIIIKFVKELLHQRIY